jgi:5'-3' exonuclease
MTCVFQFSAAISDRCNKRKAWLRPPKPRNFNSQRPFLTAATGEGNITYHKVNQFQFSAAISDRCNVKTTRARRDVVVFQFSAAISDRCNP